MTEGATKKNGWSLVWLRRVQEDVTRRSEASVLTAIENPQGCSSIGGASGWSTPLQRHHEDGQTTKSVRAR